MLYCCYEYFNLFQLNQCLFYRSSKEININVAGERGGDFLRLSAVKSGENPSPRSPATLSLHLPPLISYVEGLLLWRRHWSAYRSVYRTLINNLGLRTLDIETKINKLIMDIDCCVAQIGCKFYSALFPIFMVSNIHGFLYSWFPIQICLISFLLITLCKTIA